MEAAYKTNTNEDGDVSELPTARRSSTHPQETVNNRPFAGRIAGNQLFTLSPADPSFEKVTNSQPDALQSPSWASILDLRGFRDAWLWKMAVIEGIGTLLQTYIGGLIAAGIVPSGTETSVGAIFPVTYAAVTNFVLITLFISGTAPVTGAHFNPLITWGTFLTKLSSLPRTILYTLFQCIGAVVGGFLLRASLGASPEQLAIVPGCYIDPTLVTPGEAYALETTTSLFVLFMAFGLGLDPRNATAFGPALGAFLIGLATALTLFATGVARKGYLGSSNNPARCLGLMAAAQRFNYHWIHWVGDFSAVV
jgi:glycerol uptake facilitator-like aquaporin